MLKYPGRRASVKKDKHGCILLKFEGFNTEESDWRLLKIAVVIRRFIGEFKRIHSFRYYTSKSKTFIAAQMSLETPATMLANQSCNRQSVKDCRNEAKKKV
jgi:hypothetical protein